MNDELTFKQGIAALYNRVGPIYGQIGPSFFERAGRRLVALAGVTGGSRVLDIAAGRGAVLFPAAKRVGPNGYVLGIDLADVMVRETAAEIERRAIQNAEMRLMDAEQLRVSDESFDFVLCSFALFFFPHLDDTLAGFRRALRPGGVIGIALAGPGVDPRWQWYNDLLRQYLVSDPSPPTPPVLRERTLRQPGDLERVLTAAGFSKAREIREEAEFIYRDAHEWWAALWSHGERRAFESMTSETLARFEREVFAQLGAMEGAGPLSQRMQFIFALAKKPAATSRTSPAD